MVNFIGSAFCFWCIWHTCRISSCCNYSRLNRKFHITLRRKWLKRMLLLDLSHCTHPINRWAQHRMGILGILTYTALMPTALYLWITEGYFLFLDVTRCPLWYEILFWSIFAVTLLDFWIGYFLTWRALKKQDNPDERRP